MTYSERLKSRLETTGSALCVGLDPRPDMTKGGADAVPEFLRRVIGETAEFAAAFKPNIAYFEAMGLQGLEILEVRQIKKTFLEVMVIKEEVPETDHGHQKLLRWVMEPSLKTKYLNLVDGPLD